MTGRRVGGLLGPGVCALVAFSILIGLGTWQIERKAWKEALIATLEKRLNDAPVALPPRSEWAGMTADNAEFTRVRLHVEFGNAPDALVYTGGSQIRDDVKGIGYFVFSPARLADGSLIAIDRGFAADKSYPPAPGAQDIVGYLRWPERPSWFVAAHDADGRVWTARDPPMMAARLGWGEVAPFYIDQESPVPPAGVPHPSALTVRLRNEHLQYAITWYGLAAVLVVIFVLWAAKRRDRSAA
jgi:cytochrome oxidase assembly protein ShyY1